MTIKRTTKKAAQPRRKPKAEKAKPKAEPQTTKDDGDEEEGPKSVVPSKYRQKYAEQGHARHCGDALARALNDRCLDEKGKFQLASFEAICKLNGVDLSKYNRTNKGWAGRLRMTGRNLLAKVVYEAEGVLKTPEGDINVLKTYA